MYIPKSFSETDETTLHNFIAQNNFATLVTQQGGELTASHVPLLLDAENNKLIGHLARANPQWKTFDEATELLAIFHGPHTYISPSWYEPAPSVPTWNYAAVHVYGKPHIVEDEGILHGMLKRLVQHHEQNFPEPWPMDLPADYMHNMMLAVVGFEISITRIEGKYKLSQNRSVTDQQQVVAALETSSYPPDQAVATLMQQRMSKE